MKLCLAGEEVSGASSYELRAPWDGASLGAVPLADAAQLERAVDAAAGAARALARTPTHLRRGWLEGIARRLVERREPLATQLAHEAGKPIALARAELDRAARTFALGAEECARLGGEVLALDAVPAGEGLVGAYTRVAAGPVLAITPFNFPMNLVAHKLAPAFALGAPVVLKPAPQTPRSALALASIVREAGAPDALLSVVPTSNELAEGLARDARFAVVSFTGSAAVGWRLKALAPRARVLLELGGNAAAIVEPDAELARAFERAVTAGFGYAGQVCVKTQRLLVHRARYDEARAWLRERVARVTVRAPLDEEALCGPVVDERSAERIDAWVREALAGGARALVEGAREGNRLAPWVLEGATPGMRVLDEEVFGPVLCLQPYEALDEALDEVNRGRYGLQTALYTHDLRAVRRAFERLEVGALLVNEGTNFRVDAMPYGGVKDSGLGREGVRYAVDEMSDKKLLVVRS